MAETKVRRNRTRADRSTARQAALKSYPGLPMIRTSERAAFNRCRWLWAREWVELQKPVQVATPLWFGSLIHEALALYYPKGIKRGKNPVHSFELAFERERARVRLTTGVDPVDDGQEDWVEGAELGPAMLQNYLDHYGEDEETEILVTEHPFQTVIPHPRDGRSPWYVYTGILDNVCLNRRSKKKFIRDHKTTRAIDLKYVRLDRQFTAYWTWGLDALYNARLLRPGDKLDGLEVNYLRKQAPDKRKRDAEGHYLNLDGSISKKQPAPYFHRELTFRGEAERALARKYLVAELIEMEAARKELDAASYKNPGQWTCAGCPCFDICELHEVDADWQELRSMSFQPWLPYEAHEVYIAETK